MLKTVKQLMQIFMVICVLSIGFLFLSNKGFATVKSNLTSNPYSFKIDKKDPINFKADNLKYNEKLGLIIASGNVVITQGNQVIKADKIYIQKDKKIIIAKGNVFYKSKDGNITYGENVEIQNNFNNLIIDKISLLFPDGGLLSAKKIVKKDKVSSTYNAAYTTCKFSRFYSPFWSIRAKKITYNENSRILRLYSGWFQIKNTPLLWIPYASYAEPAKKRKMGFLFPKVGTTTNLGYFGKVPFFIPITDHTDLNFYLTYFEKSSPMFETKISSYIPNGEFNSSFGFANNELLQNTFKNWYAFNNFRYNLNNTWRLTGEYNDASSRTFLTLYPLNFDNDTTFLNQKIDLEGFINRSNYLQIKFSGTRSLEGLDRTLNPYILPQITYKHIGFPSKFGSFNINAQYDNFITYPLYFNDNEQSKQNNFDFNKLITIVDHNLSKLTPLGVFTLNSSLQNVNYYKFYLSENTNHNKNLFDSYTGGNISLKYDLPITSVYKSFSNIFDPIVQLSYSHVLLRKKHNLSFLDNNELNINILNLFENNKLNGYDFYDQDLRLNYAAMWDFISNQGFNGKMIVGQSLDLSENSKSNYLVYLSLNPNEYFNISYEAVISPKINKIIKNNLNLFLGNNMVGTTLTLSSQDQKLIDKLKITKQEEVTTKGYINISSNISANIEATLDLKHKFSSDFRGIKNLKSLQANMTWQNNCFALVFNIERSYYQSGSIDSNYYNNIKPVNTYSIAFVLKNLGTLTLGQSIIKKSRYF